MLKKFALASVVVLSIASCGTKNENQASDESQTEETFTDTAKLSVDDSTKFKFDLAVANIPPPATNIQQLEQMGMPYDNSILNDTKNASRYESEFKKSVNLGVYNIDMAYAIMNQNSQDVLNYMKTVMIVSDGLGLKNTIAGAVGKRAEANTSNRDSLIRILDDLFDKSDEYLRTNQRLYTAALIFAGSWIESLYINCKIADKASDEKAKASARRIVWEQRFHLKNLLQVLNDYSAKDDTKKLVADLTVILNDITAIKKPEDIKDADFSNISAKIYALRAEVIK